MNGACVISAPDDSCFMDYADRISEFVGKDLTESVAEYTIDTINRVLLEFREEQHGIIIDRLFTDDPDSLTVVAKRYLVTKQRIKQIEDRFLRKLKEAGIDWSEEDEESS